MLVYLVGHLFFHVMGSVRRKKIGPRIFGPGDVRLGIFVGLIADYPQVLLAILHAILLGELTACIHLYIQLAVRHRHTPFTAIPYGPFLASSALLFMLLQHQVAQVLPTG